MIYICNFIKCIYEYNYILINLIYNNILLKHNYLLWTLVKNNNDNFYKFFNVIYFRTLIY